MLSILFAVANLAALTLTLPTADPSSFIPSLPTSTNSTAAPYLSKRVNDHAWIGSHLLPGCATKGPLPDFVDEGDSENGYVTGPRPKLKKGQCEQWSPASEARYIGIFWGEGKGAIHHVEVHRSDDCSDTPEIIIYRQGSEAGHCLSPGQPGMDQWTLWNAVRGLS